MKKIVAYLMFAVLMTAGSAMALDKVRIANETATPPFNFVDGDGKIQGFDVEIAAALCEVMGVAKVDVIQDWDGMIPGLLSKKFDAIISDMSITDKRKRVVNFSDSYYDETGLFIGRSKDNFDFSPAGLKGKKIVIVDDSVVRGTTMKKIIRLIRTANPSEIHLRISSPPIVSPCFYGIDMPTLGELIANAKKIEDIRKYLDVDTLGYLSIDGMLSVMPGGQENFCAACFNGQYPISNS